MDQNTILKLYNAFINELPAPASYTELRKKFETEKIKFLNNIENQNEHTLEELLDLVELANNELMKQAYIEGFTTATNLIIESINNNKKDA